MDRAKYLITELYIPIFSDKIIVICSYFITPSDQLESNTALAINEFHLKFEESIRF